MLRELTVIHNLFFILLFCFFPLSFISHAFKCLIVGCDVSQFCQFLISLSVALSWPPIAGEFEYSCALVSNRFLTSYTTAMSVKYSDVILPFNGHLKINRTRIVEGAIIPDAQGTSLFIERTKLIQHQRAHTEQ